MDFSALWITDYSITRRFATADVNRSLSPGLVLGHINGGRFRHRKHCCGRRRQSSAEQRDFRSRPSVRLQPASDTA